MNSNVWCPQCWICWLCLLRPGKNYLVNTRSLAPVYWNVSNLLFKASSSSHMIEVQPGDDIDFVCPFYVNASADYLEYYVIYQVSKVEFDECSIHGEPLVLVNCSTPHTRRRFTVIFNSFQAIPNVPEYHPGNSYYFISTSTGSKAGIGSLQHGACAVHNMKLSVFVCCREVPTRVAGNNVTAVHSTTWGQLTQTSTTHSTSSNSSTRTKQDAKSQTDVTHLPRVSVRAAETRQSWQSDTTRTVELEHSSTRQQQFVSVTTDTYVRTEQRLLNRTNGVAQHCCPYSLFVTSCLALTLVLRLISRSNT